MLFRSYIVVKVPRFAFEKFVEADPRLTTTMKSVGESMAIGRSFPESLQKALRSLERKESEFSWPDGLDKDELLSACSIPTERRLQQVQHALHAGASVAEVHDRSKIDPWFLAQIELINRKALEVKSAGDLSPELLASAKRMGFSDRQIAALRRSTASEVLVARHRNNIRQIGRAHV